MYTIQAMCAIKNTIMIDSFKLARRSADVDSPREPSIATWTSRCFGKAEKYRVRRTHIRVALCGLVRAVISLVVGSVCVAIAFPIATGKHISDCDLVHRRSKRRCEEHDKRKA